MAILEEHEEDTLESHLDVRRGPAAGSVHVDDEGNDAEGFETASEGRGSEDVDDDDDEASSSDNSDREDEVADPHPAHPTEGIADVENKLRQVEVTEEQSQPEPDNEGEQIQPVDEKDDAARRQERIDDAVKAKVEGNSLYAEARYVEALQAYTRGLSACPLEKEVDGKDLDDKEVDGKDVVGKDVDDPAVKEIRAVLFANRAACYSNLKNSDYAAKECTKALEMKPTYLKALVRRYQAREKLTNYEEAIEDVKKVLELDPGNAQARIALRHLTPLAEEKREKVKKEMIDKLKEAGNSILGRFGMSVDNFKSVQDPNTGSYSIQFQR